MPGRIASQGVSNAVQQQRRGAAVENEVMDRHQDEVFPPGNLVQHFERARGRRRGGKVASRAPPQIGERRRRVEPRRTPHAASPAAAPRATIWQGTPPSSRWSSSRWDGDRNEGDGAIERARVEGRGSASRGDVVVARIGLQFFEEPECPSGLPIGSPLAPRPGLSARDRSFDRGRAPCVKVRRQRRERRMLEEIAPVSGRRIFLDGAGELHAHQSSRAVRCEAALAVE